MIRVNISIQITWNFNNVSFVPIMHIVIVPGNRSCCLGRFQSQPIVAASRMWEVSGGKRDLNNLSSALFSETRECSERRVLRVQKSGQIKWENNSAVNDLLHFLSKDFSLSTSKFLFLTTLKISRKVVKLDFFFLFTYTATDWAWFLTLRLQLRALLQRKVSSLDFF